MARRLYEDGPPLACLHGGGAAPVGGTGLVTPGGDFIVTPGGDKIVIPALIAGMLSIPAAQALVDSGAFQAAWHWGASLLAFLVKIRPLLLGLLLVLLACAPALGQTTTVEALPAASSVNDEQNLYCETDSTPGPAAGEKCTPAQIATYVLGTGGAEEESHCSEHASTDVSCSGETILVTDDQHNHTTTTVSGLLEADITDVITDVGNCTTGDCDGQTITWGDGASGDVVHTYDGDAGTDGTLTWNVSADVFAAPGISFGVDPADSGILRLSNNQDIAWELATPGVDLLLGVNGSDQLESTAPVFINGSVDTRQLIVQANGTQTNEIFLVESAGGGDWLGVTDSGVVTLGNATQAATLQLWDGLDIADSGAIRLGNNQSICSEASPPGTDVCIGVDASEVVQITGGGLDAADITSGTLPDARIQASGVTQHEASLTITESQVSDLTHLTMADVHRQAATDCTAETGGVTDEQCHELDDNALYVCESGPCNASGWVSYAGGAGEINTASNLGGGLANYSTKVGVDLRFNSFAAADFDLGSNLISIDDATWLNEAELNTFAELDAQIADQTLLHAALAATISGAWTFGSGSSYTLTGDGSAGTDCTMVWDDGFVDFSNCEVRATSFAADAAADPTQNFDDSDFAGTEARIRGGAATDNDGYLYGEVESGTGGVYFRILGIDTSDAGATTLKLGDAASTAFVQVDEAGAMTFQGTSDIDLPDDSVDIADLSATGTPSSSTYLRGDNTWATVSGTGDVTDVGDCTGPACFTSGSPDAALTFDNATSGTVTLQTVAGALGTVTVSLPAETGTVCTTGSVCTGYDPTGGDDLSDDNPTALSGVTTMTDGQLCEGNASTGFDCDVATISDAQTPDNHAHTDGTIVEDDLAATLTFDDGDLLDFGTNISSATEGLMLPAHATTCASATAEGQVCWEEDADNLWIGDGSAAKQMNAAGSDTNAVREYYWRADALQSLESQGGTAGLNNDIAPLVQDTGTNATVMVRDFDQSTDECAATTLLVPSDLSGTGSDTVTFRVRWYSTATTNNVVWSARHDGGFGEGTSWDAAPSTAEDAAADAVQGTTDQITVTTWTETITNLGWAASELVKLEICRDANVAGDTMAADARLLDFAVEIPRE